MTRAPAEVGSAASSYQVLAKLAVGGMAEIFLARGASDAGVERYVVLKRILRERASDVHFVQMFLDEARLAAQLQHPNIAQVYDIGKLGDSYFFTMEYVHGETVRNLLARAHGLRQSIPIGAVLSIVAGAAAGLHHAHERKGFDGKHLGIVHRDVSPSNLMISYEGTVKLVDFGVAKASQRISETLNGTVKGKTSYMSPEQCRGRDIDRRSDLFSLGIMMWELLTTDKLFRKHSHFDTMHAIVNGDVPAPSQIRSEIPPEIDHLVARLLAKDPAQRYQTADELHEAIETVAVRTGSALSTASLGRYLRDLFGHRPEPWLELPAQARHPEVLTVTREPLAHALGVSNARDRLATEIDPASAAVPTVPVRIEVVPAEPLDRMQTQLDDSAPRHVAPSDAERVTEPRSQPSIQIAPALATAPTRVVRHARTSASGAYAPSGETSGLLHVDAAMSRMQHVETSPSGAHAAAPSGLHAGSLSGLYVVSASAAHATPHGAPTANEPSPPPSYSTRAHAPSVTPQSSPRYPIATSVSHPAYPAYPAPSSQPSFYHPISYPVAQRPEVGTLESPRLPPVRRRPRLAAVAVGAVLIGVVGIAVGVVRTFGGGDDAPAPLAKHVDLPTTMAATREAASVAAPASVPAPAPLPAPASVPAPVPISASASVPAAASVPLPVLAAPPLPAPAPAAKAITPRLLAAQKVAALFEAGDYTGVVSACSSAWIIVRQHATSCTVSACKVKHAAKANRWFSQVAAAKKAAVVRECAGFLTTAKPIAR